MSAQLRPQTDIPGLFLAGQDNLTCGVIGALFAGVLAAGAVLDRNTIADLEALHNKLYPETDKKS